MSETLLTLPESYIEKMKSELGNNFEKYLESLIQKPVRGLRVNTRKISVEEFEKLTDLKIEKLNFSVDGYLLNQDDKIGNTPEHLAGLFYLQEPSSMVPVVASGIINEDRPLKVLDLCASPGGKTGQIASRISKDSILFSNEIVKSRSEFLYSNVERLGFENVVVLNEEPKNLLKFEGYFDYVFVDAPCSGEGMFRKNPETIGEWSLQNVEICKNRQMEILDIAEKLVCSGGKLIYSTCTFSKDEDENIVDWFVENKNFEIVDVSDEIKSVTVPSDAKSKNAEFARKFYPFSGDGEGQFVCVFKNLDDTRNTTLYEKKHFKTINLVGHNGFGVFKEFMQEYMTENYTYKNIYEVGNNLFLTPKLFDKKIQTALDDLKFLTLGVKLGTIEKHRFEPNHNIFMALSEKFKEKIELTDEELKKYLHGEELGKDGVKKGYSVVTKNGYALGGTKVTNSRLKNLYPKGLRI